MGNKTERTSYDTKFDYVQNTGKVRQIAQWGPKKTINFFFVLSFIFFSFLLRQ